ncbi:MAG: hypothetical protein HY556_01185 [Euryarchaeota archaeon]|nr:hypothetical protein [Euryarchaeota archaeon]
MNGDTRWFALAVTLLLLAGAVGATSEFHTADANPSGFTQIQCQISYDPARCGGNVIEDHTTYRVVVKERQSNNSLVTGHNFSAVAGYARHMERSCTQPVDGPNGLLWFNDQYFIDPGAATGSPCVTTEDCTIGCYIIAIGQGGPDPSTLFAGAVRRFVYQYTDPNGIAWETREYFKSNTYFWVVTIAGTVFDSAPNLAGGTTNRGTGAANTPNVAKNDPSGTGSNNTYVNGCTTTDAPDIPECYEGGKDHNPSTETADNYRFYNFVMLVDVRGSPTPGTVPVNKITNAPGATACAAQASDDGNSHGSQASHTGGCPHTHREGNVDLWFSHTQPTAAGGALETYSSTYMYHA